MLLETLFGKEVREFITSLYVYRSNEMKREYVSDENFDQNKHLQKIKDDYYKIVGYLLVYNSD